jgi:hypothetical protein
VLADSPEAARTLAAGTAELRRSLEDAGVNVLRLDVGVANGESRGRERHPLGDPDHSDRRNGGDADGEPDPSEATPASHTVQLTNGVLVDVLA